MSRTRDVPRRDRAATQTSSHGAQRPRHRRQARRRRNQVLLGIGIGLVLVLGLGVWVGVRATIARGELYAAKALISPMAAQAAEFDLDGARSTFAEMQEHTKQATQLTSDPIWRAVEFVPLVGGNLTAAREISSVTDEMIDSLAPLVAYTESLDPASLVPVDGAIPLEPFIELGPIVHRAAADVEEAKRGLAEIRTTGTVAEISDGHDLLSEQAAELGTALEAADRVVPLLPVMLGAEGRREYIVMFQNSAEARSLGGTALFFARVSMDQGRISLDSTVPAGSGNFRNDGTSVVQPVPEGFEQFAPTVFGRFIPNATSRPSFPSAASIVNANFVREFGTGADGVLSMDAATLGYILGATGPLKLSNGAQVDASNAEQYLLNTLLRENNTGDARADNAAIDRIYSEVIGETFSRVSGGDVDVPELIGAATQAWSERRLMFWDADPEVQTMLHEFGIDNEIPDSDDSTDRVGVYVNNDVGSKLDSYMKAGLSTVTAVCAAEGQQLHRIDFALTNHLEPGQAERFGSQLTGIGSKTRVSDGVLKYLIYIYAPTNGTIVNARINGEAVPITPFQDDGHPVQWLNISVPPGATVTVGADIVTTGADPRTLDVQVTPGVNSLELSDAAPIDCAEIVPAL